MFYRTFPCLYRIKCIPKHLKMQKLYFAPGPGVNIPVHFITNLNVIHTFIVYYKIRLLLLLQ